VSERFTVIDAAALPDDVRKECCGDHARRTAVVWDHEHDVLVGTDQGEIEDLSLFRDLSWVVDALNSVSAERDEAVKRAEKAEARVAEMEAALAITPDRLGVLMLFEDMSVSSYQGGNLRRSAAAALAAIRRRAGLAP